MLRVKHVLGALILLAVAAVAVWVWRASRDKPLPADVQGTLLFVSDRAGLDSLYVKRLPEGLERRLTVEAEPVSEPALSPDGGRAAFVVGGRIGLVWLASGDVRLLTLGIDWKDASPVWLPGGLGLVVAARRAAGEAADLHLLAFGEGEVVPARVVRQPLSATPGFDEGSPVVSRDGKIVVFLRGDHLFRLDRPGGRVKRLTGGFRKYRKLRLLPSGRLLALWSQDKEFGLETLDFEGGSRETLSQGTVFHRSVAPSPDGRYLAATFTFDLGFHPLDALRGQTEEVHLLDAHGRTLGALARSRRHANHSPDWGP